jgi:CBS domain-containing protein
MSEMTEAEPWTPRIPVRVRDLMTRQVVTIEPATTVKEIADLLLTRDIRSVPVVDRGDILVGIVSEADLISREGYDPAPHHRLAHFFEETRAERRREWDERAGGMTAGEIMSTDLVTCREHDPVAVVARRMLRDDVRTMPVVDGDRLVGVISRHDILRLFDRPDQEIRERLDHLLEDPLMAPEGARVEVTVRDGHVTLEGTTRYAGDVSIVENIVKEVPGVVGVTNRVHGTAPDPRPPVFRDTDWR